MLRCKNYLIKKNISLCCSLQQSFYFFGHNGDTVIEQERMITSQGTSLDILRQILPEGHLTVPPLAYNEFFITPWATTRELEVKHQNLMVLIGNDLKGLWSLIHKANF